LLDLEGFYVYEPPVTGFVFNEVTYNIGNVYPSMKTEKENNVLEILCGLFQIFALDRFDNIALMISFYQESFCLRLGIIEKCSFIGHQKAL
jgi:hypothetical protein